MLPALRGRFGDWAYYSCLVPLSVVVKKVHFAHEIHKNKKLSDMIQRKVRQNRAKEISDYLLSDDQRFFNSLVVAVYGGSPRWYEFKDIETGQGQEADKMLDERMPYSTRYSLGLLRFSGTEKMFALDGQHRLAGMREALNQSADLGDEELPVILVAHHNTDTGMKRTRHLFTTLNKKAKAVSKGEIIALDESDVMAIVCRRLAEEDKRFSGDCLAFTEEANLAAKNRSNLTTVVNLYYVLKNLFLDRNVSQSKNMMRLTSGELSGAEDVESYLEIANECFEDLENIFEQLGTYFKGDVSKRSDILGASRDDQKNSEIIFRPVGLLIVSELYSTLKYRRGRKSACSLIAKLPKKFGDSPYRDYLWDENTDKLNTKRRVLVRDILLYMVGEYSDTNGLIRKVARSLGVKVDEVYLPEKVI